LLPGKFWPERRGDAWPRRIVMLILGAVVGLAAVWVDGWPLGVSPPKTAEVPSSLTGLVPSKLLVEASYLSYYALAFFALRWWRLTDPRRPQRFSLVPVLAAGFWGLVLLL